MLERELIDYLLINACNAAIVGAKKIMSLYKNSSKIEVGYKVDNPKMIITEADKMSHEAIKQYLSQTRIPLLSEEGRNMLYEERHNWDLYWLVDPLDGTREFVNHNDEFVVSIALMSEKTPLFGVVLQPATGKLYFSDPDRGAFIIEDALNLNEEIKINNIFSISRKLKRKVWEKGDKLRVAITRSHITEETSRFIEELKKSHDVELITCGSSIKFCYIAEDIADMYIRFTRLYDWDLAAGVTIANAVGAVTHNLDYSPIIFNKELLEIESFMSIFPDCIDESQIKLLPQ